MIILRQKSFVYVTPTLRTAVKVRKGLTQVKVGKAKIKNTARNVIGKEALPIDKKALKKEAGETVKSGLRNLEEIRNNPIKSGRKAAARLVERPLDTISYPLLVTPIPGTTAASFVAKGAGRYVDPIIAKGTKPLARVIRGH